MQSGKTPTAARAGLLSATRVVLERSRLPKSFEATKWEGFELSQCSGTITEILAECERLSPCVLVVSQDTVEKLEADEFRTMVDVGGSVRVLVLGTRKDPSLVKKFLSMGCMGYLPNRVPSPTLRRAVRAIAAGEVWADRSTITEVMKNMILKQSIQVLTIRERDILRQIASGLSNRAIADRLCITHETVRWHIRGLYSKLGVQDRFSAIVYGRRLLDSEGELTPREVPSLPKAPSPGEAPQKRASPRAARVEAEWKTFKTS